MLKIRLRYPLMLVSLGIIYGLWLDASSLPQTQYATLHAPPKLKPGYYLVLNTRAKLPEDVPYIIDHNRSYIGPLPTIKACHEMRNKTQPLYPGVMKDLIKIGKSEEEA